MEVLLSVDSARGLVVLLPACLSPWLCLAALSNALQFSSVCCVPRLSQAQKTRLAAAVRMYTRPWCLLCVTCSALSCAAGILFGTAAVHMWGFRSPHLLGLSKNNCHNDCVRPFVTLRSVNVRVEAQVQNMYSRPCAPIFNIYSPCHSGSRWGAIPSPTPFFFPPANTHMHVGTCTHTATPNTVRNCKQSVTHAARTWTCQLQAFPQLLGHTVQPPQPAVRALIPLAPRHTTCNSKLVGGPHTSTGPTPLWQQA